MVGEDEHFLQVDSSTGTPSTRGPQSFLPKTDINGLFTTFKSRVTSTERIVKTEEEIRGLLRGKKSRNVQDKGC